MKKMIFAAMLLGGFLASCDGGNVRPLEETTWKLVSMEGIPAEAIDSEEDAFTLFFDPAEARLAGRTNCNRFFGTYAVKGSELDLEAMGMTRMACPDMQYEELFVEMLDEVDAFKIKGEELSLLDDGKVIATFRAVAAPEEPAAE